MVTVVDDGTEGREGMNVYAGHEGFWVATRNGEFVARAESLTKLVEDISAAGGADHLTIVYVDQALEAGEPES